jgi:signal transduction histidine kinase
MALSASIARARVDRLLGRVFALGAVPLNVESGFNFYSQLQYLNQPLAWVLVSCLWLSTLTVVYTFWFGNSNYLYLRIHALIMIVPILTWPFLLTSEVPQDGSFYPWIWWGVSTGWVAVAISFSWRFALAYYVLLIGLMQLIFSLPMGGSHEGITLVTDGLYTFLTNASISVIALMIKFAADKTDQANSEAIKAEVLQAEAEAKAKERVRLDGLIHDKVLTALISATQAKSIEEANASSDLAAIALKQLSEIQKGERAQESVFCTELFDSITLAAKRVDPDLKVKKNCQVSIAVESIVVSALTEATLQAVHNSLMHAGANSKRELSLKSTNSGLKIVVMDDGKGFRVSQVNRARLGIRVSIIGRLEAIGGQAHVVSQPGQGTTVVLEWNKK